MNYSYQIVTKEIDQTNSGHAQFVAHLTDVYVEIDGVCIEAPYPSTAFKAPTYTAAMLKANQAFNTWLTNFESARQFRGC